MHILLHSSQATKQYDNAVNMSVEDTDTVRHPDAMSAMNRSILYI